MRLYIFENVSKVSDAFHDGGGLVVVAEDEQHVKKLLTEPIIVTDEDWQNVLVFDVHGQPEPRVITFPDMGCC